MVKEIRKVIEELESRKLDGLNEVEARLMMEVRNIEDKHEQEQFVYGFMKGFYSMREFTVSVLKEVSISLENKDG